MKLENKRIELNWSKLLGFSQLKLTRSDLKSKSGKALTRAKIGEKRGIKYAA